LHGYDVLNFVMDIDKVRKEGFDALPKMGIESAEGFILQNRQIAEFLAASRT